MKKFAFAAMLALGLVAMMAPQQAFAADEEKPFTIHGELRFRADYDNNAQDFDSNADDGALFWPYRVRIAAEGHFSKNVVGYAEFQNTGLFGEQNFFFGTNDARRINDPLRSTTSLYQGYITLNQLWSKDFSLRFGRQEVVLGNEFILGDEDFYSGISHDGVLGMWDKEKWDLAVWYMRTVEDSVFQFADQDVTPDFVDPNSDAANVEHFGGYFTWNITKTQDVDFYLVQVNDRGNGGRWQVVGARWGRDGWDNKGLVWNFEYTQEMGDFATENIAGFDEKASGAASEGLIGWNFKGDKNVHRVYAKYEYATGDDNTTGDDFEGFVPLFGEVHNRAGRGDWFRVAHDSTALGGFTNSGGLMAFSFGYTGMFNGKHELGAAYWDYSLEQDNDSPDGSDLGTAFDVWYGYNYSKNVAFEVSYSTLSPGDALTFSGATTDDSVERLYGQIRLRF